MTLKTSPMLTYLRFMSATTYALINLITKKEKCNEQ